MPKYKNYASEYKIHVSNISNIMQVFYSVLFTMNFPQMIKRCALIRSHGSTTNTLFPMQNLSLG